MLSPFISAKDGYLEEIADTILWSFDFINDHAHAFFLDNSVWNNNDQSIYAAWVDDGGHYRHTNDVIAEVLQLKQKFVFVFDFGEDWEVKCTVLREAHMDSDQSELLKEVGDSPEQYGNWDEELE